MNFPSQAGTEVRTGFFGPVRGADFFSTVRGPDFFRPNLAPFWTIFVSSCPYERTSDYEISSTICSPAYDTADSINRSWTLDTTESTSVTYDDVFYDIYEYDFEEIFEEISGDSS